MIYKTHGAGAGLFLALSPRGKLLSVSGPTIWPVRVILINVLMSPDQRSLPNPEEGSPLQPPPPGTGNGVLSSGGDTSMGL